MDCDKLLDKEISHYNVDGLFNTTFEIGLDKFTIGYIEQCQYVQNSVQITEMASDDGKSSKEKFSNCNMVLLPFSSADVNHVDLACEKTDRCQSISITETISEQSENDSSDCNKVMPTIFLVQGNWDNIKHCKVDSIKEIVFDDKLLENDISNDKIDKCSLQFTFEDSEQCKNEQNTAQVENKLIEEPTSEDKLLDKELLNYNNRSNSSIKITCENMEISIIESNPEKSREKLAKDNELPLKKRQVIENEAVDDELIEIVYDRNKPIITLPQNVELFSGKILLRNNESAVAQDPGRTYDQLKATEEASSVSSGISSNEKQNNTSTNDENHKPIHDQSEAGITTETNPDSNELSMNCKDIQNDNTGYDKYFQIVYDLSKNQVLKEFLTVNNKLSAGKKRIWNCTDDNHKNLLFISDNKKLNLENKDTEKGHNSCHPVTSYFEQEDLQNIVTKNTLDLQLPNRSRINKVQRAQKGISQASTLATVDDSRQRRRRYVFDPIQLQILEKEFQENHYVTSERRNELSAVLNLSPFQLTCWFQNRRAKQKKSMAQKCRPPLKSQARCENPSIESNSEELKEKSASVLLPVTEIPQQIDKGNTQSSNVQQTNVIPQYHPYQTCSTGKPQSTPHYQSDITTLPLPTQQYLVPLPPINQRFYSHAYPTNTMYPQNEYAGTTVTYQQVSYNTNVHLSAVQQRQYFN